MSVSDGSRKRKTGEGQLACLAREVAELRGVVQVALASWLLAPGSCVLAPGSWLLLQLLLLLGVWRPASLPGGKGGGSAGEVPPDIGYGGNGRSRRKIRRGKVGEKKGEGK